jgi:ribosomal protein S18 acetylase RimI-like enzyme
MIEVRRTKDFEKDLPLLRKICNEELYPDFSQREVEEFLKDSAFPYTQFFLACHANRVLGFCSWSVEDMEDGEIILKLSFLAVAGKYQKNGVGKKLLLDSLDEVREFWTARGKRARSVFLNVKETNEALEFYRKVLEPDQETLFKGAWGDGSGIVTLFKKL